MLSFIGDFDRVLQGAFGQQLDSELHQQSEVTSPTSGSLALLKMLIFSKNGLDAYIA